MRRSTAAVIVATLNEVTNIQHVLDTALRSPAVIEVMVADGGSTDGTLDVVRSAAARDGRVKLIDNPRRHQSVGLNLAASQATADLLVRLDGHTTYAEDYVDASLAAWRERCAVGGPMLARGQQRWEQATAAAMADALAIGPGRFRHATSVEEVDTVYLGTFDREAFLTLGGYRTFPSGTVEDTDFYARWRAAGLKVLVDPTIRSWYRPRGSWRELARQYFRYGQGKAELMWLNRRLPSPRPLAPAMLVGGAGVGVVLALFGLWIPLVALALAWLGALAVVGVRSRSGGITVIAVAATMHAMYGVGFWWGVTRGHPRPTQTGVAATPRAT